MVECADPAEIGTEQNCRGHILLGKLKEVKDANKHMKGTNLHGSCPDFSRIFL